MLRAQKKSSAKTWTGIPAIRVRCSACIEALKAQMRDYDAGFVQKQFEASWKGGPVKLKVDDLV